MFPIINTRYWSWTLHHNVPMPTGRYLTPWTMRRNAGWITGRYITRDIRRGSRCWMRKGFATDVRRFLSEVRRCMEPSFIEGVCEEMFLYGTSLGRGTWFLVDLWEGTIPSRDKGWGGFMIYCYVLGNLIHYHVIYFQDIQVQYTIKLHGSFLGLTYLGRGGRRQWSVRAITPYKLGA